jgi:parvulin-like peptidyl-prolyl isomerase
MKQIIILILFLIVCTLEEYPQSFLDKNVARVGNLTITDREFLERYEMTPGFNRHRKSTIESQKIEFLFSLIAEKLWALESMNRGMDTTDVIKFTTESFTKMFVRDALFKKEVQEKSIASEQEILEGLNKSTTKLYVNFLFSNDLEEINFLHKLLNDGIPFDSILAESIEKQEQITPIEVVFGQMDESVEETLFNLKAGEYTKPILTHDGWYIFKLVNRSEQLMDGNVSREDAAKTVKKTLEARKLIANQKEFYSDFFRDKQVDINPKLFETLAKNISSLFEYKKKNYQLKENELMNLEVPDILKMEEVFGPALLNSSFIIFDKDPISFGKYMRMLVFDGYNASDYKINFIRASLDTRVRQDIEKELLYREGKSRGYEDLAEVKEEVQTWREHYLFQALKAQYGDSVQVSDDEVFSYYQKNHKPEWIPMQVNIIEILTDSLAIVQKVFNELNDGKDFKEISRKYNKRESTKKTDGEYGLFPVSQHGDIGRIAASMNIGDVYGPLELKEGFSVFKLIDKQEQRTAAPEQPYEKVKNKYRQDLTYQKLYRKMTDFTYSLSVKYGVSLNLDLLEQIKVTTLPSFGIRFLGFGGKMTAVPLLAPNVDWAEQWIKNQQQPQVVP